MPLLSLPRRLRLAAGRAMLLLAPLVAAPAVLSAQVPGQIPSPEQLQNRPDLVAALRQRFLQSGLTPEQVRARLRAAGYPENLLDAYLPGADTTRMVTPAPGTLDAVRILGILSPTEADSLQRLDSLRLVSDSVRRVRDSLALRLADSLRADSLADSLRLAREEGLKRFGIEIFRRTSTQFEADQTGPVDDNYQLGPGDVLVLVLSGEVEATYELPVTRDGFVLIPQVGQIYVANLTLGQLEDVLYTRLGRVYSGVRRGSGASTQFYVTVARLRNIQVFVSGDVVRPGAYRISGAGTVLTALYAAGGPTENGSFRSIIVRRGSELVDTVDVYDYLLGGANPSAARLQSGDVVFVPVHGPLVEVTGAIARPAQYELRPGETLRFLVEAAGGFADSAVAQRVQIHRTLPVPARTGVGRARVVVDVGPDQFVDGVPPVPMEAGDSVSVFGLTDRVRQYVTVEGNVWLPGRVGYQPGMRLSDALRLAGGPRPDVYLDRILVTRFRADSTRFQLRSAFADTTGTLVEDLPLEEDDLIQVFSRSTFRTTRWITVTGAVRSPGRIPWRRGMTIRDAVLLADGLTEAASLRDAEIARIDENAAPGALARTITVPLDSSYLFERRGVGFLGPAGEPAPASGAPDVELQPYDNVLIKRQPGWELQRLVWLGGEVRYPGRYALTSKTERLADLIQRAGGLTDEAYPGGVEFYRVLRELDPLTLDSTELRRLHGVPPMPIPVRERVGVDLARVLDDDDHRDNLILAHGDSIVVPEYQATILVTGAVNSPGLVAYEPGRNLDWYVRSAGGYSYLADAARAYVTQPDGRKDAVKRRAIFADYVPKPGAGAEVFVPSKDPTVREPNNLPSILGTAAQVLATIVTVIVLVTRN